MRGNITIFALLLVSVVPLFARVTVNQIQAAPNNKFITSANKYNFRAKGAISLLETFSITSPGSYYLVEDIGYEGRSDQASGAIYINSDNVVIDLGNYTLYNNSGATTTSNQTGIYIAASNSNIVIRNGNLEGFQDTGIHVKENCTDIRLQNLTITKCVKNGINFDGVADTTAITQNMITNCIIENSMVGRSVGLTGIDAVGLRMDNCTNILVNDSTFNRCDTASLTISAYGALVTSCTNVVFTNCDASGNRGKEAYGFSIATNSNACSFINCTANGNWSIGTAADIRGYGFTASSVNGCLWENCTANGNEGNAVGIGFYYVTAKYCRTVNCHSAYNRGNSLADSAVEGSYSFLSKTLGEGNIWDCCEAVGSQISIIGEALPRCVGFELDGEINSMLKGCTSRNHNSIASSAWGIGINLIGTTRCIVDNCSVIGNKSATTNHGLGLRDTNTRASTTLITRCFFFNNGDTTANPQNIHLSYATGDVNLTTTVNQSTMNSLTGINPYENVSMSFV